MFYEKCTHFLFKRDIDWDYLEKVDIVSINLIELYNYK